VSHRIFFYLSDLVSPLFFINFPAIFFLRVLPPGGCPPSHDTAATEGVTPLFFLEINWRPFSSSPSLPVLRCHPCLFSPEKLMTHCHFLLISLGCHPPPCLEVAPRIFLPVRPRFSTMLCKFAHKNFSFGCHPLDGVTWGTSAPSP